MSETSRRPEELIAASEHVLYEIQMLHAMARGLASEITTGSVLQNALTESFVIHARNLVHFFFPERTFPSDVLAEHFVREVHEWNSIRGSLPDELLPVRRRVSKEMAHITYDRLEARGEARRWAYLEIAGAIQTLVEAFARTADPDLLHSDWALIAEMTS